MQLEIDSIRDSLQFLTARVYRLEQGAARPAERSGLKPEEAAVVVPEAAASTPAEPSIEPPVGEEIALAPEPAPGEPEGPGWEAVLGGNWLNKVGVLVLVIGLGLFLWYSFGRMGPGGRVAAALAVSGVMLAGGVVLERRENYKVAARGLIGGGWAALYSTVYAAHAVEAARVIPSPTAATLLLAGVAAGMISHSLRYRSQAVTGLSYFVALVTLAMSPLTLFALIALVPLAVSLVYLAHRFRWTAMVLLGLPATYAIYMLHAARSSGGSLAVGQLVLFVYWVIFELFDVLYAVRARAEAGRLCPAFPLNAAAFLTASVIQWQGLSPGNLYLLFVLSAAAYLGSALLRLVLLPVASFGRDVSAVARVRSGSYEGAITLMAALTAVALALKLSGLNISVAFLVEAELLFFAGLYYRQPFLRNLAAVLLGISAVRLIAADVPEPSRFAFAGGVWHAWTPVALLHTAVFYGNRLLWKRATYYGHAATALLMLVLGFELASEFAGLGWLLVAVVLYEFGVRKELADFSVQSYWAGGVSLLTLFGMNVLSGGVHTDWRGWMPQICGALILFGATARVAAYREGGAAPAGQAMLCRVTSFFGTVLMAAFLRNTLTAPLATIGWAILGLMLVEAGYAARMPVLRGHGHLLGVLVLARLLALHLDSTAATYGLSDRVLTVLPVVAVHYLIWWRARQNAETGATLAWERRAARLYLYSAAALGTILWGLEANRGLVAIGWAILGLLFLLAGRRLGGLDLRVQSMILAAIAAIRVCSANLLLEGSFAGLPQRIVSTAAVILCLYAAEFLSERPSRLALPSRILFSVLATVLLFSLLAREVSGGLLTVAWGAQGVLLLLTGFPLRERCLRLSGLALLLVCVGKLFGYDLQYLETPFRILSFLVLGVILIGVSLIYSRFRERLSTYL